MQSKGGKAPAGHQEVSLADSAKEQELLLELLESQKSCVLATCKANQPYTSLMAFDYSFDLKILSLATQRETTKYQNILANPQVALLIDNRQNSSADSYQSLALTVMGTAREASVSEAEYLNKSFLVRHPQLTSFLRSSDCALLTVQVQRYVLVSSFQEVKVLKVD